MTISVDCDCGRTFKVRDELAGKRVKCPECGSAVRVSDGIEDEPLAEEITPVRKRNGSKNSSKKRSGVPKIVVILGRSVEWCCLAVAAAACLSGIGSPGKMPKWNGFGPRRRLR